ncbi:MAG TPA: hypothetical protein VFM85_01445 [Actinomycetota bacterium]|nr:hypothetical protein [Actinomycetota bacterium]
MVTLYAGWLYVLVEAGPEQAATWRHSGDWSFWKGALPNLMFPADRSWLVSTLWDDDWTCIGGPAGLVDRFLRHPDLQARRVTLGEDATHHQVTRRTEGALFLGPRVCDEAASEEHHHRFVAWPVPWSRVPPNGRYFIRGKDQALANGGPVGFDGPSAT